MFAFKKKYFFIIESIKDINLSNLKNLDKFNIIYRYTNKHENLRDLILFRTYCKSKRINFYISNNIKLAIKLKSDGVYISAHNKSLHFKMLHKKYKLIGAAHNIKEINLKILQGCKEILFSRLFKTSYIYKPDYLGIVKYNLNVLNKNHHFVPLGGIKLNNLNKLRIVRCNSFAILSEIKKKPAISNRLF